MASWKKIIVSGSNAELNSLYVSGPITASGAISSSGTVYATSVEATSFTGSLSGTVTTAEKIKITENSNSSTIQGILFATASGNSVDVEIETNTGLSYNPNTNQLILGQYTSQQGKGNIAFRTSNAASGGPQVGIFLEAPTGSSDATVTLPSSTGTIALTSQLHDAVTLGTANGLSLNGQQLTLALATTSTNGAMSSTDKDLLDNATSANTANQLVKRDANGDINVRNLSAAGDVTVTGDLTVSGTTTTLNTTNLEVADRYVLLNSGSALPNDSGIIFGGSDNNAGEGTGLVWDANYGGSGEGTANDGRIGITNNLAVNSTSNVTPNYWLAGVVKGNADNATQAEANHVGNIRIDGGEIYIYS